jgi:hypothetical protein
VATLKQELSAAKRDGLVNLPEDLFESEDIPFRRSDRSIKSAEVTSRNTDVCVIDVAIDDVGDDAVGMFAGTNLVSQFTEQVGA